MSKTAATCGTSDGAMPSTCPLCGDNQLSSVGGRAALCKGCGLLVNLEAAALDYTDGGGQSPPDSAKMRWRLENARMRLSLIAPFIADHQVFIDIGCGSGEMLDAASTRFSRRIGFDTNAPLIRYIRNHSNAEVFESPFDPALIPDDARGGSKVFALSHILEHLEHPLALVEAIAGTMIPGDLLYIEVPLHTGRAFRTEGFSWNLWNREHLALYSQQALDYIALHTNLVVVHRGTRVFARASHSGRTLLRLFRQSPVDFARAVLSKGRHSVADVLLADYGCIVLKKSAVIEDAGLSRGSSEQTLSV